MTNVINLINFRNLSVYYIILKETETKIYVHIHMAIYTNI